MRIPKKFGDEIEKAIKEQEEDEREDFEEARGTLETDWDLILKNQVEREIRERFDSDPWDVSFYILD